VSAVRDIDGLLKTLAVIALLIFVYYYATAQGWISGLPSASPAAPSPQAPGADALVPAQGQGPLSFMQYFDPVYWFAKLGFGLAQQQWNNANAAPGPAPASVPEYLQSVDMTDFYAPQNWQGGN
jgi:hypothetical protein